MVDEFVLADNLVPVLNQVLNQLKDLGLRRDSIGAVIQFQAICIESVRAKIVDHDHELLNPDKYQYNLKNKARFSSRSPA
jgi:hypothetical protein